MSPNRTRSLSLWRRRNLDLNFVDTETLNTMVHRGLVSLHPGFEYLSANHKSDYLRAQFMLNFGGLYTDLKPPPVGISFSLRVAAARKSSSFFGYRELSPGGVSARSAPEVRENWERLAGNGMFAFRKGSDFAEIWADRVEEVMDRHLPQLLRGKENLGRGPTEGDPAFTNYPIRWAELQGELFHQLQHDTGYPANLILPHPRMNRYL